METIIDAALILTTVSFITLVWVLIYTLLKGPRNDHNQ